MGLKKYLKDKNKTTAECFALITKNTVCLPSNLPHRSKSMWDPLSRKHSILTEKSGLVKLTKNN